MERIKKLLQIYWSFFKIGGLTFGGGLSMLPMLERELVQKKKWVSEDEILDYYAIGQCTPGIIAVNTATFVGYKREKIAGAIFATLGMISPSIIVISVVAAFFDFFLANKWFSRALMGVRSVVCAMLIDTIINLGKKSLKTLFAWIICAVVFILGFFTKIPTVVLVLAAAIWRIVFNEIKFKRDKPKRAKRGKKVGEGGSIGFDGDSVNSSSVESSENLLKKSSQNSKNSLEKSELEKSEKENLQDKP